MVLLSMMATSLILTPINPNATAQMYAARDIDALFIRNDGKIAASHNGSNYTSGGVTIYQGDVAIYDPVSGTQTLYINGNTAAGRIDVFGNTTSIFRSSAGEAVSENIDGLEILPNGHLLISGNNSGTMRVDAAGGGLLAFQNEDIIDYDPVTKTATIWFDGSSYFASDENIKDFAMLTATKMIFTTAGPFTMGGQTYQSNDIVQVDLDTKIMSVYMDHTLLPASPVYGIDGLALIPEPASLLLFGLGTFLLRKR